jgi:hypothetical protein
LYDELGASGLKLMENPTEVDPLQILRNYQVGFDIAYISFFSNYLFVML